MLRLWQVILPAAMVLAAAMPTYAQTPKPGCAYPTDWTPIIQKYGLKDFANPPEATDDHEIVLAVEFANNSLFGCDVHLRSYNGGLVGQTIRARPGETLNIRLINNLPPPIPPLPPHPQDPPTTGHHGVFSFNITNLHTHGLHVDPDGTKEFAGDNVLITIEPGKSQQYRIKIPADHPSGTFWYHAHVHGTTALQLASGMAGAIIIEDGKASNGDLAAIPSVRDAQRKIFVLQQIDFDENGELESFDDFGVARNYQRHLTVNGQLVPTIRMRPGEVQRWSIVHAGTQENVALVMDDHTLYEVAADGLSLGRAAPWSAATQTSDGTKGLFLAPGYRTDVLVKANDLKPGDSRHVYYLRDGPLSVGASLQAQNRRVLRAQARRVAALPPDDIPGKPEGLIARIIVEGSPADMKLPTAAELASAVPASLKPITDLTGAPQKVRLAFTMRNCKPDGTCPPDPKDPDCEDPQCAFRALVDDQVFMPANPARTLKLGTASEWTLTNEDMAFLHPFHIHVNPFQYDREEPDAQGKIVSHSIWKDTVVVPADGTPLKVRSHYTDFPGTFVLHCHILGHEDMGMMELVRIEK